MKNLLKNVGYIVCIGTLLFAVNSQEILAQDSSGGSNNSSGPSSLPRLNNSSGTVPLTGGPHISLAPFAFPFDISSSFINTANRDGPNDADPPYGSPRVSGDAQDPDAGKDEPEQADKPATLARNGGSAGNPAIHPQIGIKKYDLVQTLYLTDTYNTFLFAMEKTDLLHTLQMEGPYTVFAVTDQAFSKLSSNVLRILFAPENKQLLLETLSNHIVATSIKTHQMMRLDSIQAMGGSFLEFGYRDGSFTVEEGIVTIPNVIAGNGVIHGVDTVLFPKSKPHTTEMNILEAMARTGQFKIMLKAIEAAGLEDLLEGDGPYTIFAPTDEAFEEMPAATPMYMVVPDLIDIIKYHVVAGKLWTGDIVQQNSARTLAGRLVYFNSRGRAIRVNEAQLLQGDLEASNGVVHTIDTVLFPN